jgi:hypothetical protein
MAWLWMARGRPDILSGTALANYNYLAAAPLVAGLAAHPTRTGTAVLQTALRIAALRGTPTTAAKILRSAGVASATDLTATKALTAIGVTSEDIAVARSFVASPLQPGRSGQRCSASRSTSGGTHALRAPADSRRPDFLCHPAVLPQPVPRRHCLDFRLPLPC